MAQRIYEYWALFEFQGTTYAARLIGKEFHPETNQQPKLHSLRLEDIELVPVGPKPSTGERSLTNATGRKTADAPALPSANTASIVTLEATGSKPITDELGQARREIAEQGKDYSPLGFSDKGNPYVPVPLAGLPGLRIVEMPEMVALVKELGAELALGKMRKARGMFEGLGNGRVKLDPRIFSDPISAAKTLMHEIGHLIDYLPDRNLKRGNLWGRLYSQQLRDAKEMGLSPQGRKSVLKAVEEQSKAFQNR